MGWFSYPALSWDENSMWDKGGHRQSVRLYSTTDFVRGVDASIELGRVLAEPNTAGKEILMPPGEYHFKTDYTVVSDRILAPMFGATINVDLGVTLTINSPSFEAGAHRVFTGAGKVKFTAPKSPIKMVWFLVNDGSTNDTINLQNMADGLDGVDGVTLDFKGVNANFLGAVPIPSDSNEASCVTFQNMDQLKILGNGGVLTSTERTGGAVTVTGGPILLFYKCNDLSIEDLHAIQKTKGIEWRSDYRCSGNGEGCLPSP